jgi:hypothetical protein
MEKNGNKEKNNFRSKAIWKKFSKNFKQQQKTDPITSSRLTKYAQVHHLDPLHYEDLSSEKFIALNPMSHQTIEFIFRAKGGWKNALKNIENICLMMEKFQG